MEHNESLSIIEGMLYLSGDEGIDSKQVSSVLQVSKKEAILLLDELMDYYHQKEIKGFDIAKFGSYYKFVTLPSHDVYYTEMVSQTQAKLSKSALETLAIIAYYQPITRQRIEEIRGVGSENMLRKLLAKALIKDLGREDTPGKPILYGVTEEFMDAFELVSLDELPELKDIQSSFNEEDIFDTKYREDESV